MRHAFAAITTAVFETHRETSTEVDTILYFSSIHEAPCVSIDHQERPRHPKIQRARLKKVVCRWTRNYEHAYSVRVTNVSDRRSKLKCRLTSLNNHRVTPATNHTCR